MGRSGTVTAVLLVLLTCLAVNEARGEDREVRRQTRVMEKVFDTAMIESENALVTRGENTQGVYLEGYGVVFTLEFSFVDRKSRKLIEMLDDLDSLKVYWEEMIGLSKEGGPLAQQRREQLDHVREELIGILIGYGSTLSFLQPSEVVTVVAFPWEDAWDVSPAPVRNMTIRAKAGDLRAYGEDRIQEEEMKKRLEIVEVTR